LHHLTFPVSGEDLTPYRAASKQIMAVLQRYGTAEKLGLDEMYLDVTAEVSCRWSLMQQQHRLYACVGLSQLGLLRRAGQAPAGCNRPQRRCTACLAWARA
jgi:nucleotidyltransferase/DNA polymerase involved in DNA repair